MASNERIEFGDFQTPAPLARAVCARLAAEGLQPQTVVEPACGTGVFLEEAFRAFPSINRFLGIDVQPAYLEQARQRMAAFGAGGCCHLEAGDFFARDCRAWLAAPPEPILVLGNPPWVTSSRLAQLGSSNVPQKDNARRLRGIDAITGKSNFDVSQWMLERLIQALSGRQATVAMLCKTRVARDVLRDAWRNGWPLAEAASYGIDAQAHFGAAVDACLLVCRMATSASCSEGDSPQAPPRAMAPAPCPPEPPCQSDSVKNIEFCTFRGRGDHEDGHTRDVVQRTGSSATPSNGCVVFRDLAADRPSGDFGFEDGRLVNHVARYRRVRHLAGGSAYRWRSGIKHDCAAVFELTRAGGVFYNKLGERADVEAQCLYPLLKGSRLVNGRRTPDRWLIVPQTSTGEDTRVLAERCPRAWAYLHAHAERLDRRASSIYRGRPRFSIFGIGSYSFAHWKLAIAGLGKRLRFSKLGPWEGKPIVLDDTGYFLPCSGEDEADELLSLLQTERATEFFSCLVFWDMKRPITAEILQSLDLEALRDEVKHAAAQSVSGRAADRSCRTAGSGSGSHDGCR